MNVENFDEFKNVDGFYRCFICEKTYKHKCKSRFIKHLKTSKHRKNQLELKYDENDVKIMSNIYKRFFNYFENHRYIYYALDMNRLLTLLNMRDELKKYEYLGVSVSGNSNCRSFKNNNLEITHYEEKNIRFKLRDKKNGDIICITRENKEEMRRVYNSMDWEWKSNTDTFYKDITNEDVELKLICDMIFTMPNIDHIQSMKSNDEAYEYYIKMKDFKYDIVENEKQKYMKSIKEKINEFIIPDLTNIVYQYLH